MIRNDELTDPKENRVASDKRPVANWLTPLVDIYENSDGLTVVADLPGVGREALNLGIEQGILTLEATSNTHFGYYRRFQLPEHLDLEQIQAELKNGVLTVMLPKAEATKQRKIEVTVH